MGLKTFSLMKDQILVFGIGEEKIEVVDDVGKDSLGLVFRWVDSLNLTVSSYSRCIQTEAIDPVTF